MNKENKRYVVTMDMYVYADNDYIRNSIYSFVEMNPEKKVALAI